MKTITKLLLLFLLIGSLEGNYYQYKLYKDILPEIEKLKRENDNQDQVHQHIFTIVRSLNQGVQINRDTLLDLKVGSVVKVLVEEK